MKKAGLQGVRGGRKRGTMRRAQEPDARPDIVECCFEAQRPNQLLVADITYVAVWAGSPTARSSPTSTLGTS